MRTEGQNCYQCYRLGNWDQKEGQEKAIQTFWNFANNRQMNTQGIGLGLVITENIVKAFGGKISVNSRYGKGSKFVFNFVLGKDDDYIDHMK